MTFFESLSTIRVARSKIEALVRYSTVGKSNMFNFAYINCGGSYADRREIKNTTPFRPITLSVFYKMPVKITLIPSVVTQ